MKYKFITDMAKFKLLYDPPDECHLVEHTAYSSGSYNKPVAVSITMSIPVLYLLVVTCSSLQMHLVGSPVDVETAIHI